MGINKKMWWNTKKLFLEKMKSLLPYFIEFKKDGKILPKEYLSNCIVRGLDQQPIIMIIYNENI